MSLMVQIGCPK